MSKIWETFLPITNPARSDETPSIDAKWLVSRGIEAESPIVLRLLRRDVLPLVRRLEHFGVTDWCSFLVHDRGSGVPTTPDDTRVFIHLRIALRDDSEIDLPAELSGDWLMTREIDLPREIAGLDLSVVGGDASHIWRLIGYQSMWLLAVIEAHAPDVEDVVLVGHVRQMLHFFANMAQMRVS